MFAKKPMSTLIICGIIAGAFVLANLAINEDFFVPKAWALNCNN